MNITLKQLRRAVRNCTPGAPDSYAERLWDALENAGGQPGSFPRYPQHSDDPADRRTWPHDRKEEIL